MISLASREWLKEWAKKTTHRREITGFTEIFRGFFSVLSVCSVVKFFGKPTRLATPRFPKRVGRGKGAFAYYNHDQ